MGQKMYVLFVSERCNLHCSYCEHRYRDTLMSRETFLDVLNEAMRNTDDGDVIGFTLFGGEPLTNYDLVRFVLETVSGLQDKRRILVEIVTNLTLLTDAMLEEFKKHKAFLKIGISIDGPKEVHDTNRQSSFDVVYRNVQKVKDAGIDFGAAMVIDRKYLDRTFSNFQYLYDIGFRNFSMFINWNDLELLSDRSYALELRAQVKKILEFIQRHPDINRVKIEKADLKQPSYEDKSTCEVAELEYVGCTGNRFNCTRWKYAKGESMAPHVKGEKCEGCKYANFCCSCLGNDSFFYEGVKRSKVYQDNYCFAIQTLMDEVFAYWEEVQKLSPREAVGTYVLNGEQHLLVQDPKVIDTTDSVVFIAVRRPQKIDFRTSPRVNAIVVLNRYTVGQLCDIITTYQEQGVRHFAIRVSDIEKWTDRELAEYQTQLERVNKLAFEGQLVLEFLADVLSGASRLCDEKYLFDEKECFDVDLCDSYDELLVEYIANSPLCSECPFTHCIRNPRLNQRATGEFCIPPYQLCKKAQIEAEVALEFFDIYIDGKK